MTTTAIAPPANANLLTPLVTQSQTATAAAETQMANNVANGVNASASSALSGNFNTFLKILTTQLQNQDPTAPMDTNQFTQQLVEFSGVEQQLNTNSLLQQLVNASGGSGVKSLLGYVGQYVETPANNQLLIQNGQSELAYTLPSPAQTVALTVKDANGNTVATVNGPTTAGLDRVSWNGQDSDGNQLPDGVYSLALVAVDNAGNGLTVSDIRLVGQVTGVQTADSNGNDLLLGPSLAVKDSNVDAVFSASSIPQPGTSNSPTS